MAILNVPNEVGLKSWMLATEASPGVFVTPTARMLTDYTPSPGVGAIRRSADATGSYDRTATVRRDFADPSATFGGPATYQELAILSSYAIRGGVTGSGDSQSPEAVTYTFAPSASADDIATFSALSGVDGLPWQSTGNRFDEFNISGDATSTDDQWQFGGTPFLSEAKRFEGFTGTATSATTSKITMSGASWTVNEHQGAYIYVDYGSGKGEVRQVASNTATEIVPETNFSSAPSSTTKFYISGVFPTIAIPTYDAIQMEGTKIFLDPYDALSPKIGTTDLSARVLSFNVSQTLNLANKRRASGIIGRKGRGAREVSGTIRFEYDRWDEYKKWIGNEEVSIRIQQTGPTINSAQGTNQKATIDVTRAAFDAWTEDADNNNMTVSLTFVALVESPVWQVKVVTDLATLP